MTTGNEPLTLVQANRLLEQFRDVAREMRGKPMELSGSRLFHVDPIEHDPHEVGPLLVRVSSRGIIVRFLGDSRDAWACTWKEFRHIVETRVQYERAIEREKEDQEFLRALADRERCAQLRPSFRQRACVWRGEDTRLVEVADAGAVIDSFDAPPPPPPPPLFNDWRKR